MAVKHTREGYAGYAPGFYDETMDCSVRAFSVAACVSYQEAHDLFKKHGRVNGKRTPGLVTMHVINSAFPEAKRVPLRPRGITLAQFVRLHPEGHFIVHVKGHALAVCDGVIYDFRPAPRRRVWSFWRLA